MCRPTYLRGDLPAGPYQAVFSALPIYHLKDEDKRTLSANISGLLALSGVFVNVYQVLGGSPWVQEFQRNLWLRQIMQPGLTHQQMAQASEHMAFDDRLAPLGDRLAWHRHYSFAVMADRKAAA